MGNEDFSDYRLLLIKGIEDLEKDVKSLTKDYSSLATDLAVLKVKWTLYMGALSILLSIATALLVGFLETKFIKE